MSRTITPLLLKAPLCLRHEIAPNARYYWDNRHREGSLFVIIQQTISGFGIFQDAQGPREVQRDHAFIAIVPENTSYYLPKGAKFGWNVRWLNFDDEHSLKLWRDFRDRFGAVLPLSAGTPAGRRFEELFTAIKDQREADSFHVSEAAYSFYLAWWQQLQDPEKSNQHPLEAATDFIRSNYRLPISIKEVATHAGISREHLTRIFQERHGVSPAIFLRQLRLNAARKILRAAKLPLRDVAFRTGFPSARQLSKWLRLNN